MYIFKINYSLFDAETLRCEGCAILINKILLFPLLLVTVLSSLLVTITPTCVILFCQKDLKCLCFIIDIYMSCLPRCSFLFLIPVKK